MAAAADSPRQGRLLDTAVLEAVHGHEHRRVAAAAEAALALCQQQGREALERRLA